MLFHSTHMTISPSAWGRKRRVVCFDQQKLTHMTVSTLNDTLVFDDYREKKERIGHELSDLSYNDTKMKKQTSSRVNY